MKLTFKHAEFLGMHIGDGTLYRTNSNSLVWEQRGDLLERAYYENNVFPTVNKLFKVENKPKFRNGGKNGCYGIQTCNKKLIKYLLAQDISVGAKKEIRVPKQILNSNTKIKRAFLRGYFDTDGCLRYDASYPRMEFCTISEKLSQDLQKMLQDLGFGMFLWQIQRNGHKKEFRICLSGRKNTQKWFSEIGSNNPKHLKKFSELLP